MKYLLKTALFFASLNVFIFLSEASNNTTQLPSTKSKAPLTTIAEDEIPTTLPKDKSTTLFHSSSAKAKSNHTTIPTTSVPKVTCEQRNTSCSSCTEDYECYWCGPSSKCMKYDASRIVPEECKDNKWFWKQCIVPGNLPNSKIHKFNTRITFKSNGKISCGISLFALGT